MEIFELEIGYTLGTLPFRLLIHTVIYADKEDFKDKNPSRILHPTFSYNLSRERDLLNLLYNRFALSFIQRLAHYDPFSCA